MTEVFTNNLEDLHVSITVVDGREPVNFGVCSEPGCDRTCAANSTICYDHVADMWIDPE